MIWAKVATALEGLRVYHDYPAYHQAYMGKLDKPPGHSRKEWSMILNNESHSYKSRNVQILPVIVI